MTFPVARMRVSRGSVFGGAGFIGTVFTVVDFPASGSGCSTAKESAVQRKTTQKNIASQLFTLTSHKCLASESCKYYATMVFVPDAICVNLPKTNA
jgi:hypothetical protein